MLTFFFAGNFQLICGGKAALHANSPPKAIGVEDWGTVHREVEVIQQRDPSMHCQSNASGPQFSPSTLLAQPALEEIISH